MPTIFIQHIKHYFIDKIMLIIFQVYLLNTFETSLLIILIIVLNVLYVLYIVSNISFYSLPKKLREIKIKKIVI